jgi:transforming growth factor-beta-induced protein
LKIKDLKPGPLKTLEGGTLTIAKHGNRVTITDAHGNVATIMRGDISASNGMIQVVDRVLVPPSK